MDSTIIAVIEKAIAPLMQRIDMLELSIREHAGKKSSQYLTRRMLAEELDCSIRFIQDNAAFKAIEHRIGGRVFYLWEEVDIIIRNGLNSKEADHV